MMRPATLLLLLYATQVAAFTFTSSRITGGSLYASQKEQSSRGSACLYSKKNRAEPESAAPFEDKDDKVTVESKDDSDSLSIKLQIDQGSDTLTKSVSDLSDALDGAATKAAGDALAAFKEEVNDVLLNGEAAADDMVESDDIVEEYTFQAMEAPSATPEKGPSAPVFKLTQQQSDLISYMTSLGAITGRGEYASKKQKDSAMTTIEQLESTNPTPQPTMSGSLIEGRWELVYSSTQLFRSSPFFMAGRSVCKTQQQAKQYNWFCDMHRKALAMSTIVGVRQIISSDKLVSEFEVKAGAIPFLRDFTPFSYSGGLPVSIDGAIVSTANLDSLGSAWRLNMDTVEIKGSNIPGLRQFLDTDSVKLQSRVLGDFLESNIDSYTNPRPAFRTTFLSEQFRIGRDEDDHAFFYVKTSDSTEPTDYSGIDADLGIGRLLEGFNDAISQIYI